MLPSSFVVEAVYPTIQHSWLYPDELICTRGAAPKRQAEFGTARVQARKALDRLGARGGSLAPHADRSPRWPEGIVGSISHTEDCCAVAVARSDGFVGVGIDIEPSAPLPSGVEELICTESERLWLALHNGCDGGRLFGKLFFSAKEAVYKCQYTITRSFIDFKEVELAIDVCRGTFSVVDLRGNGRPWRNMMLGLEGRFRFGPRSIVTAAILRRSRLLC
jgi:4'-phosphopantetheinyl transferase EntD